jgi:outer membrane protein TolC
LASVVLGVAGVSALACASTMERDMKQAIARVNADIAPLHETSPTGEQANTPVVELDGSLRQAVAYALAHSPALRASFHDWQASTYAAPQARKLPEPQVTVTGFVRPVETRVGPQLVKLGVMQWFPWPSRLNNAARAATRKASAAQQRFEAHALDIAAQVSRVYWAIWVVEHRRQVRGEQKEILTTFSEMVRYRMEVDKASLADIAQVSLDLSRIEDDLVVLDQQRRKLDARMVRLLGAPPGTSIPVDASVMVPVAERPVEARAELMSVAAGHPRVTAIVSMERAAQAKAKAARGARAPSFGVGVDWVITGAALDPTMPDSGKDPVMVMGGLRVPVWAGAYKAAERQAEAQGAAFRARRVAAEQRAAADVEEWLVTIEDTARRVTLHETTLIPQSEAAYESALGGYQVGTSTLAAVLMAERMLIEHRLKVFETQAKHAVAWAELQAVVGRPVAAPVATDTLDERVEKENEG